MTRNSAGSGAASKPAKACEGGRSSERNTPLCVDLDGTLVKTDMLLESLLALVKSRPSCFFLLPFWLLKGKAHLKMQVAQRVTLDVSCLPYNTSLLALLAEQHQAGRPLILIAASDRSIARPIAEHLGLFSDVLASDGKINLCGGEKLKVLQEKFAGRDFAYAGNAEVDLTIWAHAGRAQNNRFEALLRAMRLHQWAKNALVFVPLLLAHKVSNFTLLLDAVGAFVAFGLCASSAYLLNDLVDLEADRGHPSKKSRPFAAGDLSLGLGMATIPALLAATVVVAGFLPLRFLMVLGLYYLLTLAYSFRLKRVLLMDVIVLASLYTIRIFAGAQATGVVLSPWLLNFSLFLFLSLALMKRFSELRQVALENRQSVKGRNYLTEDCPHLVSMGAASGYIAVLVLGLYISSHEVAVLYASRQLLWLVCPAMLYWINRAWLIAHRGQMNEDPVLFALRDLRSYWVGMAVGAVMLLAKYGPPSFVSGF